MQLGRYDKIDLVPFGEFVPPLFSFVNRVTQEAGDFVPGHDIEVLPAAGHRLGVFICYESAFPDLVRQFAKKGADVLVNLSNDALFRTHGSARTASAYSRVCEPRKIAGSSFARRTTVSRPLSIPQVKFSSASPCTRSLPRPCAMAR